MEWKDSLHPLDSSGAGSLSEVQENFSGQEETQLFLIESRTNCPVTKRVLLLWNSKNRERGRERVWKIKQMKVSYECSQPVFILYPLSAATKSYLMQMQCCLLFLFSPHFHCTSACPSTFCIANINIILKHHPRLSLHVSLDSQTRKYFQPWLSFFFLPSTRLTPENSHHPHNPWEHTLTHEADLDVFFQIHVMPFPRGSLM